MAACFHCGEFQINPSPLPQARFVPLHHSLELRVGNTLALFFMIGWISGGVCSFQQPREELRDSTRFYNNFGLKLNVQFLNVLSQNFCLKCS